MNLTKKAIAIVSMTLSFGLMADTGSYLPKAELETINGTFRSATPEDWYGSFGVREFIISDGRWQLIFTHALDPEMTQRTFQFRTGGKYEILDASSDVNGAYRGAFHEEYKHLTLLTTNEQVINGMGMAKCDLSANLEVDISESGCAHWRPVAECGVDYDLFAADDKGVYFGVRQPDNQMCTPDKIGKALLPLVPKFQ